MSVNVAAAPQDSNHLASPDDPAASLRAAALRTLKSKRRKLNSAAESDLPAAFPTRPVLDAAANIQLDYGQADVSSSSPEASSAAPPDDSTRMEVDDGQAREEGEISDSETTPAPPLKRPVMEPPNVSEMRRVPTLSPSSVHPSASVRSPNIVVKTESIPAVIPDPSLSSAYTAADSAPVYGFKFDPEQGYIRPGLAMTGMEYDRAKELILDLLGWGVPPDYLVRCGLSREIVYYAFLDFNLRLPKNFDSTGLPTVQELTLVAASIVNGRSRRASTSPSRLPSQPMESVQPASGSTSQTSTLSAVATPFVPVPSYNGLEPNLLDMEQQHRRELMARKAVQASRKSKLTAASASPVAVHRVQSSSVPPLRDSGHSSSVPPMAVDDFLKSIEPARDNSREGSKAPVSRVNSLEAMDVDPPGLAVADLTTSASFTPSTFAIVSPISGNSGTASAGSFSSTNRRPPSPLQRTDTERNSEPASKPGSSSGSTTPPVDVPKAAPVQRRGTKRPVAADFVDMDPGPTRAGNGHVTHSAQNHHNLHQHHGPPRRRLAGFAVVSSKHRRMVIDLTDSEDEGDIEEPRHRAESVPLRANAVALPMNQTQAELEERESAIRRLKDEIARKQLEARLKREAALASGRGTPIALSNSSMSIIVPAIVKQEEDYGAVSASLQNLTSTSVDEPPDSSAPSLSTSTAPSTPATPIDIARNTLEHPATGDKVLTDEARQEQVITQSSSSSQEMSKDSFHVDAVGSQVETPSAQIVPNKATESESVRQQSQVGFTTYQSPLTSFPRLRLNSQYQPSDYPQQQPNFDPASDLSGFYISNTFISLRPLREAAAAKWFTNPSVRICQYEVPGGGECRDSDCSDLHLSRMTFAQPDDEETAEYLSSVLPTGSQISVNNIVRALQDARRHAPTSTADLETRVTVALASLGVR